MREKSRIYECIEFDIGDVEVMTSCTDNKNVLNRIVGWSTPIIDKKKKKEKSEETYWKKKWKKSDETYYWEKKVFKETGEKRKKKKENVLLQKI